MTQLNDNHDYSLFLEVLERVGQVEKSVKIRMTGLFPGNTICVVPNFSDSRKIEEILVLVEYFIMTYFIKNWNNLGQSETLFLLINYNLKKTP